MNSRKITSALDLEKRRDEILAKRETQKRRIAICAGTGCLALGARKVIMAFKEELKNRGLESEVELRETGCPGFCEKGTIVVIYPEGIYYLQVQPGDVPEIVEKTVIENKLIERLIYTDPVTAEKAVHEGEIPFYRHQMRLLIGDNINIDSKNIEDYIALGGYSALSKALSKMTPEGVIEEVKRANLRGRGGGGFPAGRKWETTRNAPGKLKYVIVNCDEGDPGAFMDRALMEGNPHSILEGLIIGGYAMGSHKGFIYVREEYPLAVENTRIALEQARAYGLLGRDILGSGFDFDVEIYKGAGAFVSGESSALMSSLEGKVGAPKPKYVRTAVRGLWNQPTNLNNVETWANVPHIINKGADWFTSIGTAGSTGTKIFSLVGKVNNTGLVEVPMGITLREIIYNIGGGVLNNKKFKAVQTGGPSGGCIPENLIDTAVDFDALSKLGSMMGSGGMIVMDEDTCMVDVARYFIDFLVDESCGNCVPCREGLERMSEILTGICEGLGAEGDIELLEELSEVMADTSMCGLGSTAPNPVLTTIQYFRDEYDAHIKEKKCPAHVCKALIAYYIDAEKCTGCLACLKACPEGAISGEKEQVHTITPEKCSKCGVCYETCKFDAVRIM
jgi:NADH:ubiquinone oxidoreductase subunit F (NADH-binding)/(2Fe-2S) ferredoxin/Pyruvate/2-oxoacid:ferredoxin oxidoreductase delta subunit